jgi:predicted RND superfamily exporter protein
MKKLADFLVDKRLWFFIVGMVFAAVCLVLMFFVNINYDLTAYLAKDSAMREGLDIMTEEFPAMELPGSFKIMFENLKESEKLKVKSDLEKFEGVASVSFEPGSISYNTKYYTLYAINTERSESAYIEDVLAKMVKEFGREYSVHTYYNGDPTNVLDTLIPLALSLLAVLLLLLCRSYFEPILLVAAIGVAVVMNMGTNIIFESVSNMTFSIAAVLQLVLSIDYSIMLLHRYEQERELLHGEDNVQAMKNAVANAISSIASSAFTTIVGFLMLLFMSFTIGADIGLVLSKGVAFSLICVFTVMPSLILWSDKLLFKLKKKNFSKKHTAEEEVALNA